MPLIYFNSQSSLQVIAFPGHVLNIKTSPAYFRKQIMSLAVLWVLQKDFKVQDSQKFENLCLWFIFTVSRSFMLFVFWKVVSVRKRRPLFLKKSVSRYHFCVSQNSSWKSEMATLSSTRRPRVKVHFQEEILNHSATGSKTSVDHRNDKLLDQCCRLKNMIW